MKQQTKRHFSLVIVWLIGMKGEKVEKNVEALVKRLIIEHDLPTFHVVYGLLIAFTSKNSNPVPRVSLLLAPWSEIKGTF